VENGAIRLRDLGSSNGTVVNGQRIAEEVDIKDGDLVQVGPLGFRVVIDAGTVPDTTPPPAARPTPRPPTPAREPGKLGSRQTADHEIEQWLMSDSKHEVPQSPSGVYDGDTQMLRREDTEKPKEGIEDQAPATESGKEDEEQKSEEFVETESGRKVKIGGARQKIEKTREDTSRAASDILRRMMQRRPGK
jgi:pSer/pThr/pTyr-binding forkhead associated (FHA) protein